MHVRQFVVIVAKKVAEQNSAKQNAVKVSRQTRLSMFSCILNTLMVSLARCSPHDNTVSNDQARVRHPLKLDNERLQAMNHVDIGLAAHPRVSVEKLISLACLELLRVFTLNLSRRADV